MPSWTRFTRHISNAKSNAQLNRIALKVSPCLTPFLLEFLNFHSRMPSDWYTTWIATLYKRREVLWIATPSSMNDDRSCRKPSSYQCWGSILLESIPSGAQWRLPLRVKHPRSVYQWWIRADQRIGMIIHENIYDYKKVRNIFYKRSVIMQLDANLSTRWSLHPWESCVKYM